MAKGKAKSNSSEDLVPPESRSHRSRKRKCPSDESSLTDDVQATLHQQIMQVTERNNTAVASPPLQCTLQECAMITHQQDEGVKQSDLLKPDDSIKEKHAGVIHEAASVHLTDVAVTGQEETNVTKPKNDSELEVDTDNDANNSGKNKEENASEDRNKSPYQTRCGQLLLSVTEEGDGFGVAALEKNPGAKEGSNVEENQETNHSKPSTVCMNDGKELTKEAAVVLSAKKKRRMGMYGPTERERSQFLLTQKHESGPNGMERAEKESCNNITDPVALDENKSSPPLPPSPVFILAECITEQSETELQLQSSHCEGDDSTDTKVLITATVSDGTGTVCSPGYSEGRSCEAEGATVPGPEPTGSSGSDQPAEEEEREHLGNKKQQELGGSTAEVLIEIPEKQSKMEEDGSTDVDSSSSLTFYAKRESEKQDAIDAAILLANSVTITRDETKEKTSEAVDGDGAGEADTQSGGLNASSMELCEAAVTPSVSEKKDNCDPDDEPSAGSPTMNAENTQTRNPGDPSGCLDYVSDSQLNTIVLIEEKMTEKEQSDSSNSHEDASELISGLIRELSSLNQRVMAAHRELENLRRGSKNSRSSKR
ncbi:histone acetyltransferase KAT6B isoform X1 [Acanthochromis polyacanthus]|uniref:histone acetyltransferase KAT6B isoform X1 n=1 Tax=Acanthochromis polyacanthus TaxID=80966 RepID=UPI002233E56C|nr:histone acetyltransferase KAT6B isoform X1 [Acanthochromis polyacanthus]